MAPAAKRRRTNTTPKYLCYGCDTERTSNSFPDVNPSSECEHLINTCKTCLKKWVAAQVESSNFTTGGEDGKAFGIACPQCEAVVKNVNVEDAATKTVHKRFEEMERKHIADNTPGWRWCMNAHCRAGQVHEMKVASPKIKKKSRAKKVELEPVQDLIICVCHECGAKACVVCDRPWHEGETCAEFQTRVKDRVDEEDKTLEAIRKVSRPCPGCKKQIQKDGGCPMMYCES